MPRKLPQKGKTPPKTVKPKRTGDPIVDELVRQDVLSALSAKTGRWSSKNPNIQTIPSEEEGDDERLKSSTLNFSESPQQAAKRLKCSGKIVVEAEELMDEVTDCVNQGVAIRNFSVDEKLNDLALEFQENYREYLEEYQDFPADAADGHRDDIVRAILRSKDKALPEVDYDSYLKGLSKKSRKKK